MSAQCLEQPWSRNRGTLQHHRPETMEQLGQSAGPPPPRWRHTPTTGPLQAMVPRRGAGGAGVGGQLRVCVTRTKAERAVAQPGKCTGGVVPFAGVHTHGPARVRVLQCIHHVWTVLGAGLQGGCWCAAVWMCHSVLGTCCLLAWLCLCPGYVCVLQCYLPIWLCPCDTQIWNTTGAPSTVDNK